MPYLAKEVLMWHLEITAEERDVLHQVLESEYSELRGEVSATARHAYKEMLKHREALIRRVLMALEAEPIAETKAA
jgi:hypothetical protein